MTAPQDVEYSEAATRCDSCGALHVIFRSHRPTHGMAVAKEVQSFSCRACNAPLMDEDVGDNEHVMVVAASDPLVEKLRHGRKQSPAPGRGLWPELRAARGLAGFLTGPLFLTVIFFGALLVGPYLLYLAGAIRKWWVIQCAFFALGVAMAGGWTWLAVGGKLKGWADRWPSLAQLVATVLFLACCVVGFLLSH
jgi:hypothetical protein